MSTKKITALTELSAAPAATDMFPMVDVSDTTDASSGTTKKITATNIAKGVGIGAGNTTAEPLKIDTSNMRIGIGTGTPQTLMEVKGVAGSPSVLTMSTAETTVVDGDKLGQINFQAPQESSGTDAILVGASIYAEADDTFAADNNATELVFATGASEAAAEKVRITSDGKLGIGTAAPGTKLEVFDSAAGNADLSALRLTNYDYGSSETGQSVTISGSVRNDGGGVSSCGKITFGKAADYSSAGNRDGNIQFITNRSNTETEAMRISSDGNVGIGASSFGTNAVSVLGIANGTVPASSPANMVQLYAEDVSTSELKVRDEAGNVSTLSPHNFELLGERSETMAWSYAAKNVFVGKEVAVDMMKVIRSLEKLTGETFIKIRDLSKSEILDWDAEEKKKEDLRKQEIAEYNKKKAEDNSYPTDSSTKSDIKTFLDNRGIEYQDGTKSELLKKVPEKEEFLEPEPAAYVKKSKPSWMK